jgi:small subunit ribosomal protein S4
MVAVPKRQEGYNNMSNFNVCSKCRRAGKKLFLKGEKCLSQKCSLIRRNYAPGQHGTKPKRRLTEYAIQLQEKQSFARMYGLRERQMRNYYKKAAQSKVNTADILLQLVEMRLDNVIFRLGFAQSRPQSRNLIRDGQIMVNEKKIRIASYRLKKGDQVSINPNKIKNKYFQKLQESIKKFKPVAWLKLDHQKLQGQVENIPQASEIEIPVDISKILEFYSR